MNRRGMPALLLPLLAAFAIFYPGTRQLPAEGASVLQSLTESQLDSENEKKSDAWPRGPEMVREFLDVPPQGEPQWPENDRRQKTRIDFLIATLPDPVESGLPHQFDRLFSSVQSALQGASSQFVLTSFDMPWMECLKKQSETKGEEKEKSGSGQLANCGSNPRYAQVPGVALFGEPGAAAKAIRAKRPLSATVPQPASNTPDVQPETHLLLLYVVGETPTSGIHKAAMSAALNDVAWFCGFRHDIDRPLPRWLQGKSNCGEIRILGPSFSGSAQSVDFALSSWLGSLGKTPVTSVKMLSGSATAIRQKSDFLNLQRIFDSRSCKDSAPNFCFHSMQASSRTSFSYLLKYISEIQPCGTRRRIALLSEGNTVYGQSTPSTQAASLGEGPGKSDGVVVWPCNVSTEVTTIPFPLHVSQLRAALERLKSSQRDNASQSPNNSDALPLDQSLEEVNQRHDSVPPLSQLDTATAELVMANLLTTISQEKYHYVGILATDVRDVIFLAQEIREHCPETIVFAFNPDLLFLHPDENPSLRGMLLVTSYPLFTFNQLWSPPYFASEFPDSADPTQQARPRARLQFPDQAAEGIYLATLALLDSEKQMLEFGMPFKETGNVEDAGPGLANQNAGENADAKGGHPTFRPPLWITVVGRNRMWPVQVYDLDAKPEQQTDLPQKQYRYAQQYLFDLTQSSAGTSGNEKALWWRGLHPVGASVLLASFSIFAITFCILICKRNGDSPAHTPREYSYLLAACATLAAFLTVGLSAFLVPFIVMAKVGSFDFFKNNIGVFDLDRIKSFNEWGCTFGMTLLSSVALLMLAVTSYRLLLTMIRQAAQSRRENRQRDASSCWIQVSAGAFLLFSLCLYLGTTSLRAASTGRFHSALFSSMRSLYLLSGVSPLLPVFLVSMAGFVWAIGSFMRVRALRRFSSRGGFLSPSDDASKGKQNNAFGPIGNLENGLWDLLHCSAMSLPKRNIVVVAVFASGTYLYFAFVRSIEDRSLYLLLLVSFVLVNLVLWLGVLRFFCIWRQMHRLLRQISWTPLGSSCSRFRKNLPSLPKIDLASPAPTLSHLMYSVEYSRALCEHAKSLLPADKPEHAFAIAVGAEGRVYPDIRWRPAAEATLSPELNALERLASEEFCGHVHDAEKAFEAARNADASNLSDLESLKKCESQTALSRVTGEVAAVLQDTWWNRIHDVSAKKTDDSKPTPDEVFRLGEDFLVGRLASLVAHILPQMQNLILTSVTGLLLVLLAVSSYPFQPHDLLLLLNWTGILSFVGTAMWVFFQMNRDPILSSLNGTKPGQINWNMEFIIRIVVYGIVPILALLGAQFPHSVGQVVSHFIPSEAMHQ
jgi:heme exporter protein D